MADSAFILSVSHKHEAIADWLLANPAEKLGSCAEHFKVSQPWLSIVIHSKVFVEYFRERRRKHEDFLRERITSVQFAVTQKAYEKLLLILEDEKDGRLILDVAERTATMLGFAPRKSQTRVVEEFEQTVLRPVSQATLADARERMTRRLIRETPVDESAG